jgi:hypothetical protein
MTPPGYRPAVVPDRRNVRPPRASAEFGCDQLAALVLVQAAPDAVGLTDGDGVLQARFRFTEQRLQISLARPSR